MSYEDFMYYHKTKHALLFTLLPEVKQYVRKYTQCLGLPLSLPGMPEAYFDDITDLWFDDVESIGKVFSSENYMQKIRPDEEKFLDLPKCGFLVSTENLVM